VAGVKKEQDDVSCNAPVRRVEDISEKAADVEVHEVSGPPMTMRSIE